MDKTGSSATVEHEGTVQNVGDNSVLVRIVSSAACSGCHAESVCSLSGREDKIVDVSGLYDVSPGDRVTVLMKQSQGFRAVLLGYIVPFAILVASLVLLIFLSFSELFAGVVSLLILFPYYLTLYFFRDRINKKFTFTIKT